MRYQHSSRAPVPLRTGALPLSGLRQEGCLVSYALIPGGGGDPWEWHRLMPELQRRLAPERLGVEVDEIDGGHTLALSRSAELADRLEAYRAGLR